MPPQPSSSSSNTDATTTPQKKTTCNNPLIDLDLPSPLILGSGSFTRKLILSEMGIPYHLAVRSIDEKGLGDRSGPASELVTTLALAKSDHLVSCITTNNDDDDDLHNLLSSLNLTKTGGLVLTADQVVTHDGSILEKPSSVEEARQFVKKYATSSPSTVGAVVITHVPSMLRVWGVDSARINFRASVADESEDLVGRLVEEGAPVLSCAGGLMVEHPFVKEHIESIDGSEDSVMGLSKDLVLRLLSEMKEKLMVN